MAASLQRTLGDNDFCSHCIITNHVIARFCLFTGKKFRKAHIASVLTDLKAMGHKIDSTAEKLGSINVISQQSKKIATFADENNDGGSVRF